MKKHTSPNQQSIDHIMDTIRVRFYRSEHKRFFRDQQFLLYTITWPASWLQQRGLHPSQKRYQKLIIDRLDDIQKHGHPGHYMPYFPRYLLKSLQDYFKWHGDQLYQEFKHIRNALESLDSIIKQLQNNQPPPDNRTIEVLAQTHHILHSQYRRKSTQNTPRQLSLF